MVSRTGPFEGGSRYNTYGAFLRRKFGCRVYKVSVDAGFTCPNRDGTLGTGGCTYCSNQSFLPPSANRNLPLHRQIDDGAEYLRRRYRAEKFIVYFQPFSNTHAPLDRLVPLYEEALSHEEVVGISIGTRADCVDEGKIAWLENLARRAFVVLEYGLESVYDRTLKLINRGHDFARFLEALKFTQNRGLSVAAHVILGFPWETRQEILDMAHVISGLSLDILKLHHLHVLRDTPLGLEYSMRPFPLPSLHEYVALVVDFLERLDPEVKVERLFGQAPAAQLLAPHWGKNRAQLRRAVEGELAARQTFQGRLCRRRPEAAFSRVQE
jgi:radical SAM protein (TIGR01212 family)